MRQREDERREARYVGVASAAPRSCRARMEIRGGTEPVIASSRTKARRRCRRAEQQAEQNNKAIQLTAQLPPVPPMSQRLCYELPVARRGRP